MLIENNIKEKGEEKEKEKKKLSLKKGYMSRNKGSLKKGKVGTLASKNSLRRKVGRPPLVPSSFKTKVIRKSPKGKQHLPDNYC